MVEGEEEGEEEEEVDFGRDEIGHLFLGSVPNTGGTDMAICIWDLPCAMGGCPWG